MDPHHAARAAQRPHRGDREPRARARALRRRARVARRLGRGVRGAARLRDVVGSETLFEVDQARLLGDPALVLLHTTRSSASFSWNFVPRREPPKDSPTGWWYG